MTPTPLPPVPDIWRNQHARLFALRRLGFNPQAILDVGAYHGHWSNMLRTYLWPAAAYQLVEANEDCRPQLDAYGFPYQIAVLAESAREATFHKCQTGCGEGNSLYAENSPFPFTSTTVQTQTLDALFPGQTFDLVKMDAQGCELDIVAGGLDLISRAHCVLLETQVQTYNEGAPHLIDVVNHMHRLGFRLFDLADMHYGGQTGLLLQLDLLFARSDSPLFGIRPLA